MPALDALCADLVAEHADLDAVVAPLDEAGWDTPTPAAGWAVRDQVGHLAFFDEQGHLAATDPEAFAAGRAALLAATDGDALLGKARAMTGGELLTWWRHARVAMVDAFAPLDPAVKLPWYGPPMSPASFVTARLMETWAHGQDVVDAFGLKRGPTDRLHHIAHLGVVTRGWSFTVRGLEPPADPVRVELRGPGGDLWAWGDEAAAGRVTGPALDFCLLVTQRRHRADLALTATGEVADRWLDVAQAFAGPPGPGRAPSGRPRTA